MLQTIYTDTINGKFLILELNLLFFQSGSIEVSAPEVVDLSYNAGSFSIILLLCCKVQVFNILLNFCTII